MKTRHWCLLGAAALTVTSVTGLAATTQAQDPTEPEGPESRASVDGWKGTLNFSEGWTTYTSYWDQPIASQGQSNWTVRLAPTEFFSAEPSLYGLADERRWFQGLSIQYEGEWRHNRLTRDPIGLYCSPSASSVTTSDGFHTFMPGDMLPPNWVFALSIERFDSTPELPTLLLVSVGIPGGGFFVPARFVTTHNNDCPNYTVGPIVTEGLGEVSPFMSNGVGSTLVPFFPARWPTATWPMPFDVNGERRLQGSDSGTFISGDPTTGNYTEWTFTYDFDLVWVPAGVDSDGDGIIDTDDNCPDEPGPISNNGCPIVISDCDDVDAVTSRGYTTAHFDADLDAALLPDPEFFDWDVSARWCVIDGLVVFDSVAQQGFVTLNWVIGGAIELLTGVWFRWDPDDDATFVTPVGRANPGEVFASGTFEACVNPLVAATAVAGPLTKLSMKVARSVLGNMPKSGSVVDAQAAISSRVDGAVTKATNEIQDRAVQNVSGSGYTDGLPDEIREELFRQIEGQLAETRTQMVSGTTRELNVGVMADSGTLGFFAQYADDAGTISIPKGQLKAARAAWNNAVGFTAGQVLAAWLSLLTLEKCGSVWQPQITMSIPASGASSISNEDLRSVFAVKGGIDIDERP
jgi:hypothetical protein